MTAKAGLAGVLAALALTAGGTAQAQPRHTDTVVGSCVHSAGSVHCVRQYRYDDDGTPGVRTLRPPSEDEVAEARERDRRWVARCRPKLRQDTYGVSRYYYAAPGCEYGKFED